MENRVVSTGKKGDKIRSDCFVEITSSQNAGNEYIIKSKVSSLYGKSIEEETKKIIEFFGLQGVEITVEDYGALPFTLHARIEAAVKRYNPELNYEFLPPFNKNNKYSTTKERLRRSRLYLPGNEPKFFPNAGLHSPDGIILDLEDSVAPTEKDTARILVRNTLAKIDFYGAERMVRINPFPIGKEDLKSVIPQNVNVILLPKCESKEQVLICVEEIEKIKSERFLEHTTFIMPIIESAKGVINSYEIASAHESVCALALGLEDYTADIGAVKSEDGKESFFARSMVVNSAKAARIQAIDTVYSDAANMEGLRQEVLNAKVLGFEGKGCIHPRQIKVIHDAFKPSPEEVDKARKIADAYYEAEAKGIGVVSVGSKMIDPPVVKRALKILEMTKIN